MFFMKNIENCPFLHKKWDIPMLKKNSNLIFFQLVGFKNIYRIKKKWVFFIFNSFWVIYQIPITLAILHHLVSIYIKNKEIKFLYVMRL